MDNYMYWPKLHPQEQLTDLADCRIRKPSVEDDMRRGIRSKKMKLQKNTEHVINNNRNSNFTSSKRHGSVRTSRSPPVESNSVANASNAYKIPPPRLPSSPAKAVNWRLACFLASEYLSGGTLLGKPWPTEDSDTIPWENYTPRPKKKLRGHEASREKEALYSTLTANFLLSDDIHIPHIFNPSQLAAWLGFK
ncbi:hypothetical protein SUGI_0731580 [Cryptomeria japonica]|uniref:uncharacterized protein LOC131030109 n=1 Tax=Cryptomeria japonica TaxID=3369 RepID=UPI002414B251|nr:uncharacterized protein LOC131030109 [Cryptomeria japonica]GLJ36433.1 hypothetical protein SUGI_0731580 [Cryptomeria japonica]